MCKSFVQSLSNNRKATEYKLHSIKFSARSNQISGIFFKILNSATWSWSKAVEAGTLFCSCHCFICEVCSLLSDTDHFNVNCRNVNLKLVLWFPLELTISKNSTFGLHSLSLVTVYIRRGGQECGSEDGSWNLSRAGCVGDPATSLLRKLRQEVRNLKAVLSSGPCLIKKIRSRKALCRLVWCG